MDIYQLNLPLEGWQLGWLLIDDWLQGTEKPFETVACVGCGVSLRPPFFSDTQLVCAAGWLGMSFGQLI
jgi:hypothetical protein